jgi:hypothetical protein
MSVEAGLHVLMLCIRGAVRVFVIMLVAVKYLFINVRISLFHIDSNVVFVVKRDLWCVRTSELLRNAQFNTYASPFIDGQASYPCLPLPIYRVG